MDIDPETSAQCDHGVWDVKWCGEVYGGRVEALLQCHYCHVTASNQKQRTCFQVCGGDAGYSVPHRLECPERSNERMTDDYWATYREEQR